MKRPEAFQLDVARLPEELAAFEALLGGPGKELSERRDLLPFFKTNLNLAALIGHYNPLVGQPNVLKPELEIFGDYACDLVVGEKETGQFCFVEFENAGAESLFKQVGQKGTPDWSPRLERGFSQIIDWFYLLADNHKTQQFKSFFSIDLANYCGLLILGREGFLTTDEMRHRLRWRSQNTLVAGKQVHILTFDALLRTLRLRVDNFTAPHLSRETEKPKTTRGPTRRSGAFRKKKL